MNLCFLLLFCGLVVVSGKATDKSKHVKLVCEGVHVRGNLHRRRFLFSGVNRPYHLVSYNHAHQIFYSCNVGDDTKDTFEIQYVTVNDTKPNTVHGVTNGFALALDEHNKKIYFGGSDGIYEADLETLEAPKHMIKKHNIWDLFYHKNHLYFIDYPHQRIHSHDLKGNKTKIKHEHIKEKIYQFVIDGDGDEFITMPGGVYEIKKGSNETTHYSGPTKFRAVEVNHKGVVHFAATTGIYVAHKQNHTLSEIASIRNVFGLAFDAEDNIIYSNAHQIIKLVPHDCK